MRPTEPGGPGATNRSAGRDLDGDGARRVHYCPTARARPSRLGGTPRAGRRPQAPGLRPLARRLRGFATGDPDLDRLKAAVAGCMVILPSACCPGTRPPSAFRSLRMAAFALPCGAVVLIDAGCSPGVAPDRPSQWTASPCVSQRETAPPYRPLWGTSGAPSSGADPRTTTARAPPTGVRAVRRPAGRRALIVAPRPIGSGESTRSGFARTDTLWSAATITTSTGQTI
jgi:hypothetical protein